MADSFNKYPIRRDGLISPWGVGSIVPFPYDESLMVAGLNFWFDCDHNYEDFIIIDERLSKRLGGKQFVMPPDFRDKKQDQEHAEMKIPAVRFPLWHYCPVCGNMEKLGESGEKARCTGENRKHSASGTYCSRNAGKPNKLPKLVPERFIAVCEDGHIEDFPIMEWVHAKSKMPYNPETCRLYRSTGGSTSSLSGIRYTCTCGASATMNGAFAENALSDIGYTCKGNRPWLGEDKKEDCGKNLIVLQRGASNVWFADIISSIYIPWLPKYKNAHTKECILKCVNRFISSRTNGEIDMDSVKKFVLLSHDMDPDIDILQALEEITSTLQNARIKTAVPETDDEYRKQEFDVLTRTVGTTKDELFTKNYPSNLYMAVPFLKSVSLVHKLRETRVFLGFRRISPDAEKIADISIGNIPWLPAIKNSGEGIMLEFEITSLNIWAKKPKVIERTKIIEQNLKNADKLTTERLNPVYVLLHTFSHCLITALSNESGYSNASIREKIYCSKYIDENTESMAGILIYTASGDSEGSLGGLVRQGRPGKMESIIARAINDARWCAADPVCIQSSGQGQNGCNLAACHNCALLPETSCENKNMLLDRGLMIGTLDDSTIGYFNEE